MELEPGYLDRTDMPLGPRVFTDGLFEGLADPMVGALSGSDGGLWSLQGTIAGNVPDGLDARFTSTVGAAEAVNEGNSGAGNDQTAYALVDAGDGSEAYRQSVQSYLPQPDAPIEGNFKNFPDLGQGHGGGGGVDNSDPVQPEI